eukprot:UN02948
MRTNTSIVLNDDLTSNSNVKLVSNRDCSGSGSVTIASASAVSTNDLEIYGGDLLLSGTINVGSSKLSFIEYCESSASLGIGGTPTDTMSISDTELTKITSSGIR